MKSAYDAANVSGSSFAGLGSDTEVVDILRQILEVLKEIKSKLDDDSKVATWGK